jgi:hypothetical protein
MWRIICEGRRYKKAEITRAGMNHVPGAQLFFNGLPLPVGENYVIFSRDKSLIVSDPPVIALYQRDQSGETWHNDRRSRRIREIILGNSGRSLRTSNRQQPHRHVRRDVEDNSWLEALQAVLNEHL